MEELLGGVISLLMGGYVVFFRKTFARHVIESQNRFWGFHFGERELKITEIISVIVGGGFIIFGLLSIFQIIQYKSS